MTSMKSHANGRPIALALGELDILSARSILSFPNARQLEVIQSGQTRRQEGSNAAGRHNGQRDTTPGEDLLPLGGRQTRHEQRVEDDHEPDPSGGHYGEPEDPTVGVDERIQRAPSAPDQPGQAARHRAGRPTVRTVYTSRREKASPSCR